MREYIALLLLAGPTFFSSSSQFAYFYWLFLIFVRISLLPVLFDSLRNVVLTDRTSRWLLVLIFCSNFFFSYMTLGS